MSYKYLVISYNKSGIWISSPDIEVERWIYSEIRKQFPDCQYSTHDFVSKVHQLKGKDIQLAKRIVDRLMFNDWEPFSVTPTENSMTSHEFHFRKQFYDAAPGEDQWRSNLL